MTRMEIDQGHAIIVRRGDITTAATDAIVNAANEWLTPGGGVSGAIHRAGGPAIAEECRAFVAEHGALAVGSAAITTGGALPSRYVIHAVGPVWHHGRHNEAELLGAAYRSAIDIADEYGLVSVAFPSISTGVFGYPVELAAPVALEAIIDALSHAVHVREVEIVLFDETSYATWADVASDVLERP